MKVCNLSSGSGGNCTYVETSNHKILIDIGNSCLYTEKALNLIGIDAHDIDIVLVTHAHIDHVKGIKVFNKKYKPQIYITDKILKEANLEGMEYRSIESISDLNIKAISLSHDTADIKGYIIEDDCSSMVYITDTGYVSEKYFEELKNKNLYIFESNHDVEMLMNNPNYPYNTKIRILSDKGHLSNKDSAYYLSKLVGDKTKYIILAHLSEQNNTEKLAYASLDETLNKKNIIKPLIAVAKQNQVSDIFEI